MAIAGALLAALPLAAGRAEIVRVGEEFVVNLWTTGVQSSPSVAMDAEGRFVVVWAAGSFSEDGPDGSEGAVRGRRFDADGNALGGEFQINSRTQGSQGRPAVAAQPDGELLVVWQGYEPVVNGYDGVFAQRYAADGKRIGTEFALHEDPYLSQDRPSVAALGDGRFVVAWSDTRHVRGATLFPGATPPERFELSARDSHDTSVAAVGREEFVVVWADYFGTRYGTAGDIQGAKLSTFDTEPARFSAGFPQGFYGLYGYVENGLNGLGAAGDRKGRFVVAHSAYVSGYLDHSEYPYSWIPGYNLGGRIERFVDGETTEQRAVNSAGDEPFGLDVASTPAGNFIVVWHNALTEPLADGGGVVPDTEGFAVFARDFGCDGAPKLDAEVQVNTFTTRSQLAPAVALAPDGAGVIVWVSARTQDDFDVVGQRFRLSDRCALCGDADDDGLVRAGDALAALRAAVQGAACEPARCDVDASGATTAVDALAILADAVGLGFGAGLTCGE